MTRRAADRTARGGRRAQIEDVEPSVFRNREPTTSSGGRRHEPRSNPRDGNDQAIPCDELQREPRQFQEENAEDAALERRALHVADGHAARARKDAEQQHQRSRRLKLEAIAEDGEEIGSSARSHSPERLELRSGLQLGLVDLSHVRLGTEATGEPGSSSRRVA